MGNIKEHKKEIQRVFEKRRDVYMIMAGTKDKAEFAKLYYSVRALDKEVSKNAFAISRLSRQAVNCG